MRRIRIYFIIFLLSIFFSNNLIAKKDYFNEGRKLYNEKKFSKSKFKFEQDIVFNPKSENSYLYLAKIFNKNENEDEEEKNLDNVLLLNPKNEEAIYNLAKLKLIASDFETSKKLNKKLMSICNNFCNKSEKLKIEIENLSKE